MQHFCTRQHTYTDLKQCLIEASVVYHIHLWFLFFRSQRGAHRQVKILRTGKLIRLFHCTHELDFVCVSVTFISYAVWDHFN